MKGRYVLSTQIQTYHFFSRKNLALFIHPSLQKLSPPSKLCAISPRHDQLLPPPPTPAHLIQPPLPTFTPIKYHSKPKISNKVLSRTQRRPTTMCENPLFLSGEKWARVALIRYLTLVAQASLSRSLSLSLLLSLSHTRARIDQLDLWRSGLNALTSHCDRGEGASSSRRARQRFIYASRAAFVIKRPVVAAAAAGAVRQMSCKARAFGLRSSANAAHKPMARPAVLTISQTWVAQVRIPSS